MSQPQLNYNQKTRVTPIRFELKTGLHITPPNQIQDKQLQILKNAAKWSRQHAGKQAGTCISCEDLSVYKSNKIR